ncbi:Crp/Fnr family transcriptional regulator [Bacillus cereus]|uniref:Crp/Fnr family transcriptional regulator n=1 Tax=Bacillus cereus TaxID=1396 RepID=A0A2A9A2P4_BACCE|nr:Crp/Fnr family transcriptional regulator [Bacillus cereus]RFB44541.1 Crp/Fnr family transcriptional regulator [Bacillus sp. dmp10]PEW52193.1 Crp/Fnr family transcriptional regulator [Bacillus cereus]PFE17329.1 Crp/Fnr family transcriptional regulator [Bacillus cereus]PFL57248.1 Crp/Fnr family transcriptional regulator [Bacillus cereus]PGU92388.1 Crp/Fnr family transcriptional regulator [Bacillus cereus]
MKFIHDLKLLETKLREYHIEEMFNGEKQPPFTLQQYGQDEIVLLEGSELESLLFLVEGKVKITSSVETGKLLLLRFVQPFSIIGDIELIRNVPVQSQVKAINECLLIGLHFDYIKEYEMNNPKFLHTLLEHVSYKLQTCTTASRVNLLASVENKFASYLMSTISPDPDNIFGLELKTSNIKEIADLLGTTYRHLNRVIHSLSEKKIIERDKNSIRILNWSDLKEISNGIRYK